ncbi:hypothetical protein KRM28CT15_04350 [Krasilnikovia sp. M28-CT-15]
MPPGAVLAALLVAAMLAVGTTVEGSGLARVLRRPVPVAVAVAANALVMPGLAVLLLAVFDVSGPGVVGVVLAAAAPGGGSAALLAHHARADAALAVRLQAVLADGEHAGDAGARPRVGDLHVTGIVQSYLAAEQFAARVVADGDEDAGDVEDLRLAGVQVVQPGADDRAVLAEDFLDCAVPFDGDLVVGQGAGGHGCWTWRTRWWTPRTCERSKGHCTGPSPVDRGRLGSKHHPITDASGLPLAVILTGGNRRSAYASTSTVTRTSASSIVVTTAPTRTSVASPHAMRRRQRDRGRKSSGMLRASIRPHRPRQRRHGDVLPSVDVSLTRHPGRRLGQTVGRTLAIMMPGVAS